MKILKKQNFVTRQEQFPLFPYLFKWLFLSALSGACIGSASALLLVSLDYRLASRSRSVDRVDVSLSGGNSSTGE